MLTRFEDPDQTHALSMLDECLFGAGINTKRGVGITLWLGSAFDCIKAVQKSSPRFG
jgi:hypothetical protein